MVTDIALAILASQKRDLHAEVLKALPAGAVIVATMAHKRSTDLLIEHGTFDDVPIGLEPPPHPIQFPEAK